MEKEEYIKKWLDGTLTGEERKEVARSDEFHFLNRLDQALQQFKAPEFDITTEEARFQLPSKAKVRPLFSNVWLKAAATVLLVLAVSLLYVFKGPGDSVEIASSGKTDLYLPDSSFVSLNAHSSLTYYKNDSWTENRSVELEGEAFFKVAKGSRFDVVTSFGTVSVLGTAFNVQARDQYFEVSCFEGTVSVQSAGQKEVLYKNQVVRVLDGAFVKAAMELDTAPHWLLGESHFQSMPFIYVVRELERQYQVEVVMSDTESLSLFTGSFTHSDLGLALKSITMPMNLSFRIEKDQVVISGDQ